ncbi:MAG: hypothetical protein HY796_07690 [Elusimicrobia bacterium]|nr:hypothetical protein [Elusimicrobiota bacterium]
MRRISAKPTVYLIDGSNFSRSFRDHPSQAWGEKPDALECEFLDWLDEVSRLKPFRASCFRVIFDGGFRQVKSVPNPSINIYFSDSEPADDILLERASFMFMEGVRCVIVSSDGEIRRKAAAERLMSMPCDAFFRLCDNELRKKIR